MANVILSLFNPVLDVVAVTLCGGTGDHLADESGKEEHHSEDDRKDGEVEQRLVCDGSEVDALGLVYELGHDHPDRHHESYKEHQQA